MAGVNIFNSGNPAPGGDAFVNGDIRGMLLQQASIHLAGSRLETNRDPHAYELVWVADMVLQQHRSLPVSSAKLYQQIGGRSFLIGLLTGTLHKTTPAGAWWKVALAVTPHLSTAEQVSPVRVRAYNPAAKKNVVGTPAKRSSLH